MHVAMPRHSAEIDDSAMRAVEQPQLGFLPPAKLHADFIERRVAIAEPVLDHPLRERFCFDQSHIAPAGAAFKQFEIAKSDRWHDPINH